MSQFQPHPGRLPGAISSPVQPHVRNSLLSLPTHHQFSSSILQPNTSRPLRSIWTKQLPAATVRPHKYYADCQGLASINHCLSPETHDDHNDHSVPCRSFRRSDDYNMTTDTTDDAVMAANQTPTFRGLPFDVHFEVAKHLGYADVLNLRKTCRYFHDQINPRACLPASVQRQFVMKCDQFRHNGNLWACHHCYRLLPIDAFGNRMRKKKSGKSGERLTSSGNRFCWECGQKHKLYDHLVAVRKGSVTYYLCHQCGIYRTHSTRCERVFITEEGEDGGEATMKKVTVCWGNTLVPTQRLAPIEQHAEQVLKRVVRFLDYGDVLHLAQTSRQMRDLQPTNWVPLHERFRFVHQRVLADHERNPTRNTAADKFGCYACFRIRPAAKFTRNQLFLSQSHPETFWKRRCNTCVTRLYLVPNGQELRRWRERRLCGTCNLLRMKGPCQGCRDMFARGELDTLPVEEVLAQTDMLDFTDSMAGLWPAVVGFDILDAKPSVRTAKGKAPARTRVLATARTRTPVAAQSQAPARTQVQNTVQPEVKVQVQVEVQAQAQAQESQAQSSVEAQDLDQPQAQTESETQSHAAEGSEDEETLRLQKFHRRFWHGEMTTAERSLYARIEARIHNRWQSRNSGAAHAGGLHRVTHFFRRCECLAHRNQHAGPSA